MFPPNLVEACFKQVWNLIFAPCTLDHGPICFSEGWNSTFSPGLTAAGGTANISLYYSIPHASFSNCLYMGASTSLPSHIGRKGLHDFGLQVWAGSDMERYILQKYISSAVLVPLEAAQKVIREARIFQF